MVLSNNDGCIIARSNEAKALGLAMGDPLFKVREVIENHNVAVFSSNYALYGDMSRRVMMILEEMTPGISQYSIDECFVDLSGLPDLNNFGKQLVRRVERATGIPVTLGIAETKTLAKVASKFGKKFKGYEGVCIIDSEDKREKALRLFDIGDVWGIGRRKADKLRYYGVNTAWDFCQKSESWVKRQLTITGVRTWRELQGESCINIDELPQKQSICTSRSFPDQGISELPKLEEAVAHFAANCARKMREQHSCCKQLTIFAHTSRFRLDLPQHYINVTVPYEVATNSLQELVGGAVNALHKYFKPGMQYKKAGVILWAMQGDNAIEQALFDPVDRARQKNLTQVIDELNRKNGHNMVRLAVMGNDQKFNLKSEHMTRRYTTNIREIMEVK